MIKKVSKVFFFNLGNSESFFGDIFFSFNSKFIFFEFFFGLVEINCENGCWLCFKKKVHSFLCVSSDSH